MLDGGQWHDRHTGLGDLPHFTRLDDDDDQPAAATSSHESQLDAATDGLEDINIS